MTPANEAPKLRPPCGIVELPRLVRVRMDYQCGHESVPGTMTLAEARAHGASQKDLGPLSGNLEIYDAATGAWLETWYMDGGVERAP